MTRTTPRALMESRVEVSSIPKASVSVSNRRAPDQDERRVRD